MRLHFTLIAIILATLAAGRTLDLGEKTFSASQMARNTREEVSGSRIPVKRSPRKHTRQTTKTRRDGAVHGFFDDDFADDADWRRFTEKGGALMCGLNGDDVETGEQIGDKRAPPSAASPWTGDLTQDLETWMWSTVNPTTYSCKMNDHWNLREAMRSLGLNGKPQSEGGDNACYRVEHWSPRVGTPAINQWYTVDGTDYQATQAHYEFGVNRAGGAMYGFFLDSPVYAASTLWYGGRKPADSSKLPKLRAFSDILWGHWVRNNADVKNVRHFFMLGISNDETNQLIATCLKNKGSTLKEWPGTKFDTTTDEGHALLGSPNGAAFAYFLMQHKKELGPKTITHVTVFRGETDDDLAFVDPHLAFHVQDLETEVKDEKDVVGDKAARSHGSRL